MKTSPSIFAAVATLLLHMAMVTVVASRLVQVNIPRPPSAPIVVELLPPPSPTTSTPPTAAYKPPQAAALPPEKKRSPPKTRSVPKAKPARIPQGASLPSLPPPPPDRSPQEESALTKAPSEAASREAAAPASTPPPTDAPPARTEVSTASYASSNLKPAYPRLSRINEEEGTVVLRVLVKPDGTAGKVEIKTSSGYRLLDESARSAVQTWRFNPATVDGKPVAEWYQIPIPFTLRDN